MPITITQDAVAQAIRETWEAIDANPSITREGALHILAVKFSHLFLEDPNYSEREFFDLIEGSALISQT